MATNITIEQATGTQLVIPEAGVKRRGEINISANNGFFKVERGNTVYPCVRQHTTENAGVTITGLTPSLDNPYILDYPTGNNNTHQRFKGIRFGRNGNRNEYRTAYAANGYDYGLVGGHNVSKVIKRTITGQNMDCLRKDSNDGYYYLTSYPFDASIYDNTVAKFIISFYIESENFDNQIIAFGNNLRIFKDGYEKFDGSNWGSRQAYPNNYMIPSQQWIMFECDTKGPGTNFFKEITNVKITDDNGEHLFTELDNILSSANNNYNFFLNNGGGDTADDFVIYSQGLMFPYEGIMLHTEMTEQADVDKLYQLLKTYLTIDPNA